MKPPPLQPLQTHLHTSKGCKHLPCVAQEGTYAQGGDGANKQERDILAELCGVQHEALM